MYIRNGAEAAEPLSRSDPPPPPPQLRPRRAHVRRAGTRLRPISQASVPDLSAGTLNWRSCTHETPARVHSASVSGIRASRSDSCSVFVLVRRNKSARPRVKSSRSGETSDVYIMIMLFHVSSSTLSQYTSVIYACRHVWGRVTAGARAGFESVSRAVETYTFTGTTARTDHEDARLKAIYGFFVFFRTQERVRVGRES